MYDERNDAKPSTLPMYPRRPELDDVRWRDVAVRRRTRTQTVVLRFPADREEFAIMSVYAGDTIAIIPEVQFDYYVVARVGYHIGWVNFKHVKLLSLKPGRKTAFLEDTKPDAPDNRDEQIRFAQHRQMQQRAYIVQSDYSNNGYDEEETQPAYPERRPPPIPKKDVYRIIEKIKSLGGIFSRR